MAVIDDSRIRGVALTGGVAAARDVAERAGRNFRKSTMELGGSDAFIVLEDADPDLTLKWAMWAKMNYMGQCCIAAKRFIIMESVADRFLEKFKSAMAELKPGDPMDKNTKLGPSAYTWNDVFIVVRIFTKVVLFTTSLNKVDNARKLGADEGVHSKDEAAMKKHLNRFHFILDTVGAKHDINDYLVLLRRDCNLTQVGVASEPLEVDVTNFIFGRRSFSGSLIGGLEKTQEMLDFCGKDGITSDIELIPIQQVNEAYDRLVKGDLKYRFVIEMASLKQAQ